MTGLVQNRELKHYCADFRGVRRVLRAIGARRGWTRTQVDTYFRVPEWGDRRWRLKLRVERGRRTLVAYTDEFLAEQRLVQYAVVEVAHPAVGRVLASSLGVSAVVRKRREQWRSGTTLFNLDTIDGVGRVFEVEVRVHNAEQAAAQIVEYRALFGPHLGPPVLASNEDLLAARSESSRP